MPRLRGPLVMVGLLLALCGGPSWVQANECGTPIEIETIGGGGDEINATLSNDSGAPASGYLTLDFSVGGSFYVWSILITMPAHSSANVTITFDGEPTLYGASSCSWPGGTTESPDPVVGIQISRGG